MPSKQGDLSMSGATITALFQMQSSYQKLKALGWSNSIYAPKDGSEFLSIEAGSTGIHKTTRDENGSFWIHDGDTWPSRPILWKAIDAK